MRWCRMSSKGWEGWGENNAPCFLFLFCAPQWAVDALVKLFHIFDTLRTFWRESQTSYFTAMAYARHRSDRPSPRLFTQQPIFKMTPGCGIDLSDSSADLLRDTLASTILMENRRWWLCFQNDELFFLSLLKAKWERSDCDRAKW